MASTLSSTLPLSAREMGQPSFAVSAADWNVGVARARERGRCTVKWLLMTVQPASSLSAVTVALTSSCSAVKPALARRVRECHREAAGVRRGEQLLGAGQALWIGRSRVPADWQVDEALAGSRADGAAALQEVAPPRCIC